jgi:hypothetical protein
MLTVEDRPATSPPATGQLTNADLYALVRNTRSWVMVIAWIVVIQATLAIGFGAIVGIQAAKASNASASDRSYGNCIAQGNSLDACAIFKN